MVVELLAMRYGELILLTDFDDVEHCMAACDAAIEHFPGPWSPQCIFVDSKPLKEPYDPHDTFREHTAEEYAKLYAEARRVEY